MERLSKGIKDVLVNFAFAQRHFLWSAIAPELFLQKDKAERLALLNERARSVIAKIRETYGGIVQSMLLKKGIDNSTIGAFADIFMDDVEKFTNLKKADVEKYQNCFKDFDFRTVRSNDPADILTLLSKRDEVMSLPSASLIVDIVGLFCHLDLINMNRDAILHGKPMTNLRMGDPATKFEIKNSFEELDRGYLYAFKSLEDFDFFTELLARFFDEKQYEIPSTGIPLKPRTDTQILSKLGDIYTSRLKNMRKNTEYYNIVRVLKPFSEMSDEQLYKKMRK